MTGVLGLLLTALAYAVGACVFYFFSRQRGFDRKQSGWLLIAALVGGTLGAKVSSLLIALVSGVSPQLLILHPDGRTIIGGVLFGWCAVEFAKQKLAISRSTGDAFALALSCGEAIGRIGCFFNGCCYGAVCSMPWAVYQAGAWRHPSQLYSALAAPSIFGFLIVIKKKVRYEGDLFRIYLLLFGASRFLLEFVRERTVVFLGLSMAQWVAVEITVSMVLAIAYVYRKSPAEEQVTG